MYRCPSNDKKQDIKNKDKIELKTSVCDPDCGSTMLDIESPAVEAIFSPARVAEAKSIFKINPTDNPIPISDKINNNKLNPSICCISGTFKIGNKNAVKLILITILTCNGIPDDPKKGALIIKEDILREAIKKASKY